MSRYIAVWQDVAANHRFELESLLDCLDTLRIDLNDEENRKVSILSENCLAYRRMDEGDALVSINSLISSGGTAKVFYRVEESDFLEWFHSQSFEIHRDQALKHFSICTTNHIIDLIAFDEPKIIHVG